jgi:hypothetical protein
MANSINIVGARPRKIDIVDRPMRTIDPTELAATLGARPSGPSGPRNLDLIDLAELGAQLLSQPQSTGDDPALADAIEICRVPLSVSDVKTLEAMVDRIGDSTGVKPSIGQLISAIVRTHLDSTVSSNA